MNKWKQWFSENRKEIGIVAAVIAVTVAVVCGIFLYWANYKVIWFCDEIYSYFTANSAYSIGNRLEYGQWYSTDFVIDDMTPEHGQYFFRTRHNVRTDDHPPIYFVTMHLMSLLAKRSVSKWVGLSINLICVIGIAVLAYLLFYMLTRRKIVSALATIALCSLPSMLTCSMLIRMYCMMTMWACFYALIGYILVCDLVSNKALKIILHILLSIVTACGFLTQYYFAVFAVGYTAIYVIYCIAQKKWRKMVSYIEAMMFGVWIATLFWPDWIYQLFYKYCGEAVFSQASDFSGLISELIFGLTCMPKLMFYKLYLLGMVLMIGGYIYLMIKKHSNRLLVTLMCGSSLFYSLVVAHVTPEFYLDYRYFYMATVIMYVGFLIMMISCIDQLKQDLAGKGIQAITKLTGILLAVIIVFNGVVAHVDGMAMGYVDRSGEYNRKREILKEYSELPWVLYGYENWTLMETYYDLTLGSQFIVYSDSTDFDETQCLGEGKDFLLFFNNSFAYDEEEIVERINQATGCEHEIEYLFYKSSAVYLVRHVR